MHVHAHVTPLTDRSLQSTSYLFIRDPDIFAFVLRVVQFLSRTACGRPVAFDRTGGDVRGRCNSGNRWEGWYGTTRLGLAAERCPVAANTAPGRGRRFLLGTETTWGWLRFMSAQMASKLRELPTAGQLTDIIVGAATGNGFAPQGVRVPSPAPRCLLQANKLYESKARSALVQEKGVVSVTSRYTDGSKIFARLLFELWFPCPWPPLSSSEEPPWRGS